MCNTPDGFVEVHGDRVTLDNYQDMAQRVAVAQAMGRKALYRINRDVSLSRAIGDFDLREYGVVATPDVTVYSFAPPSDGGRPGTAAQQAVVLLVLATDGVWDVMDANDVTSLLEESPEAVAAARNARAAAGAPWMPDVPGHTGTHDAFLPALAPSDDHSTDEAAKKIAAANEAVNQVAQFLVKAAKGVTKNNDDVTALVAALVVSTSQPPAEDLSAASLLDNQPEPDTESLPVLSTTESSAMPDDTAVMDTSPAAADHFAANEE